MSGDKELLLLLRGVTVPSEVESTLSIFLANPFFMERETFSFPMVRVTPDTEVGQGQLSLEGVCTRPRHIRFWCQRKHVFFKRRVIAEGFV